MEGEKLVVFPFWGGPEKTYFGSTPHPVTVEKQLYIFLFMKGPKVSFTSHCYRMGGLSKIC